MSVQLKLINTYVSFTVLFVCFTKIKCTKRIIQSGIKQKSITQGMLIEALTIFNSFCIPYIEGKHLLRIMKSIDNLKL